jgi:hypothetical protein
MAEQPVTEGPAGNVTEALRRVMRDLGGIGKDQKSPQGYAYRGIEQITSRAQQLFAQHGVVVVPTVVNWPEPKDLGAAGLAKQGWTDERLTVRFRFYGPGGADDYIDAVTVGIGRDNSDKGANKAVTQALKYALLQVLCIGDPAGDTDAHTDAAHEAPIRAARGRKEPAKQAEPLIAAEVVEELGTMLRAVGKALGAYPPEWVEARLPPLSSLHTLPASRVEEARRILTAHAFPDVPADAAAAPTGDAAPAYGPGEEPF